MEDKLMLNRDRGAKLRRKGEATKRVIQAADRWELARAKSIVLGAGDLDKARFFDAAEELGRAVRALRKRA